MKVVWIVCWNVVWVRTVHPSHWLSSMSTLALFGSIQLYEASIHWRFSLVCIGSCSDALDPLVCIKCAIHASAAQCNTSLLLLLFPGIWPQISLLSCQCSVLTKCKYYKQKLIVVLWCHALSTHWSWHSALSHKTLIQDRVTPTIPGLCSHW